MHFNCFNICPKPIWYFTFTKSPKVCHIGIHQKIDNDQILQFLNMISDALNTYKEMYNIELIELRTFLWGMIFTSI